MSSQRILFLGLAVFTLLSSASLKSQQLPGRGFDPEMFLDRAESGDPDAQFQLGIRLATAPQSTEAEVKQGVSWIRKAADQGHLPAAHVLGEFYAEGIGVAKDAKLAAQWQQKAADKGMPEAQLALAFLYEDGKGVEKSPEKASELTLLAAKQEFSKQSVAQTFYAHKLLAGSGVKKNSSKAATWFLKAAKLGHPGAQRQLAYLYYTADGVPLDYARCRAWYGLAARGQGDPWAKNDYAWFLATCPDTKFHDGADAVNIVKQAIKDLQSEVDSQRYEMVDTMAAALARNGQYAEAIIWQKRSLSLLGQDKEAEAEKRTGLEKEFNERLALYKANKPYSDATPKAPEVPAEPLFNDNVLELSKQPPQRPVEREPGERQPREPVNKGKVT